ncbi:MAG TPA: hypothetical protein VGK73_26165 [Polyangiaceae bacterium]
MTLVIAHKDGWMAADRREVFEGQLLGPYRVNKIKRGQGILVASAGNGVFQCLIQEALDDAPPTASDGLRAVIKVFRDKGSEIGGHALALTREGICEITSRGGVSWLASDYWAIGSGYQFAIGYLTGVSGGGAVTDTHALHAINVAERFVNDVGDGYQLERLE